MVQHGERPAREAVSEEVRAAPNYQKILVGTDGSACSLRAGEHAVYLAGWLGAELIALNVVNVDWAYHAGVHYGEAVTELEKNGQAATEAIEDLALKDGIRCERRVIKGYKPHQAIVEVAEREGVDCIVVGSIGMSAFERVMLGSESGKVVKFAKCPVLLVR
jgi:nucleotide-binding universal stress UspA family protein